MKKQSNRKTAIYCRVARKDFNGITAQQARLGNYLRQEGIKDYGVYVDNGFSGITLERPSLTRLLEAVENGHIEKLVITNVSRLSRSLEYVFELKRRFKARGVKLVALEALGQKESPFMDNLFEIMKGGRVNGNS